MPFEAKRNEGGKFLMVGSEEPVEAFLQLGGNRRLTACAASATRSASAS